MLKSVTPVSTSPQIAKDDLEKIFASIEYDPSKVFETAVVPRDFEKWIVRMQLKTGSLRINTEPHQQTPKNLTSLTFEGFKTEFLQRPDSWRLTWDLEGMSVFDGASSSSLFPMFVQAKSSKAEDANNDSVSKVSFFHGEFEQNPLDVDADVTLKLKVLPLEIVYSPYLVTALIAFFKPPASEYEAADLLRTYAEDTVQSLAVSTRAGLEYAVLQQKSMLMVLDLKAPIIIVPESVTEQDTTVVVVDMGHLLVESKPVSSSVKELVKQRQGKMLSESEFQDLQQLIYDKWVLKLSNVQFLVGHTVKKTLEQLSTSTSDPSCKFHFIERIEALVDVDICHFQEVELPKVKVSARIPDIQVNFSDFKYQRLMFSLDYVLAPLIGTSMSKQTLSSSSIESPGFRGDSESSAPEVAARRSSPSDTAHSKGPDTSPIASLPVPVTSSSEGDLRNSGIAVIDDPRHIFFQLCMELKRASIAVKKSNRPHEPETMLADLTITGLGLQVDTRKYDLSVALHVHDAYISDMVHTSEQRDYLMEPLSKRNAVDELDPSRNPHLVVIRYLSVSPIHPEFGTKYDSVNQTIDVAMQTVLINLNPESVLSLYDFAMVTFTTPSSSLTSHSASTSVASSHSKGASVAEAQTSNPVQSPDSKLSFNLDLKGVRAVILTKSSRQLATADIKRCQISVATAQNSIVVKGTLGNILLEDNIGYRPPFREIISIAGDRIADFEFQTFNRTTVGYPGYDSSLKLSGDSIKFTYLEQSVASIIEWISEFERMRQVYESARKYALAAIDSAVQIQQSAGLFHFDVHFKSPVVVLPRPNKQSFDFLEAHLGEISARNEFQHMTSNGIVLATRNSIKVDLQSIALESSALDSTGGVLSTSFPILKDLDIGLAVNLTSGENPPPSPVVEVQASLSPIRLLVNERQYAMMLESFVFLTSSSSEGTATGTSTVESKVVAGSQSSDISLSLRLDFVSIVLELFDGDGIGMIPQLGQSLARATVNDFSVKVSARKNSTLETEVRLGTISVFDTRTGFESHYRDVLLPGSGHQQVLVDYSMAETGHATIVVTVDSPKAILPMKLVFGIVDWVMHPKHYIPPREITQKDDMPSLASLDMESQGRFSFRIKFVDADIAILDDPSKLETEAVYLEAKQVVVTFEDALRCNIKEGAIWICAMDRRADTALRLFYNFDLSAMFDKRITGPGHHLTNIVVDVPKQLNVRLSYNDIQLFRRLINKLTKMFESTSMALEASKNPTPKIPEANNAARSGPLLEQSRSGSAEIIDYLSAEITRHESLRFCVAGIQFILIDDMKEPVFQMLDIHIGKLELLATNWSNLLDMNLFLDASVNYYNLKVSQWEPLLEPVVFNATIARAGPDQELTVDLSPKGKVEINLTHQLAQSCLDAFNSVGNVKERNLATRKAGLAPYLLRNRTGYELIVTSENGAQQTLENDSDTMYKTQDWKKMREVWKHFQLHELTRPSTRQFDSNNPWYKIAGINIESEGVKTFILRPPINGAFHRLVVDIRLRDKIKFVTFRSTLLVKNECLDPVEVKLIASGLQSQASGEYRIGPGDEWAVPIEAAYHDKLQIKPLGKVISGVRNVTLDFDICAWTGRYGYAPEELIDWKKIRKPGRFMDISCPPLAPNLSWENFSLFTDVTPDSKAVEQYPDMTISIFPPLEIENLLPFDFRYVIVNRSQKDQRIASSLRAGQVGPIHGVLPTDIIVLDLDIPEIGYQATDVAILSNVEIGYQDDKIELRNANKHAVLLRLKYIESPARTTRVQLYCPYWILNKTNLDVSVSAKSVLSSSYIASQRAVNRNSLLTAVKPFLFSFPSRELRNRAVLTIGSSAPSRPITLDAVGGSYEELLPSSEGRVYHTAVNITEGEGKYHLTKVVTIAPRFIIKNDLDDDLCFKQYGASNGIEDRFPKKSVCPLMLLEQSDDVLLRVHLSGLLNEWSTPFRLTDVGRIYLKLGKMGSAEEELLRVTTKVESAIIFVHFSREERWPYRIDNNTDIDFYVFQKQIHPNYDKDNSKRKYPLSRKSYLNYAWDDLLLPKSLVVAFQNIERKVSLQEIGPALPMRIKTSSGERLIDVEVKSDGLQIVLALSNYDPAKSRFRESKKRSSFESARRSSFETVRRSTESDRSGSGNSYDVSRKSKELKPSTTKLDDLERIRRPSPSLGADEREGFEVELLYASLEGVTIEYRETNLTWLSTLVIKWLQLDNQMANAREPIILYPTVVPKEQAGSTPLPVIQGAFVVLKDQENHSYGLPYVKSSDFLIQELSVELDEDVLVALIEMTKFQSETESSEEDDVARRPKTLASFFLDVLTTTIGNVHDARLDFGMLYVENMIVDVNELGDKLAQRYYSEVMSQIHRVIGSADVLGNPVGLFTNISSGVQDFFYEPIAGIVDVNPESVVRGFQLGTSKLLNKTAFSVSDTFQKISGSLGKGLAVASMDDEYQRQRRMASLRKNRPKDPLSGITSGVMSFGQSLTSAVTGVVTQPMKGASKGVEGLAKGLMMGTLGLVTKPVAGIFDLASNVTDGIRASTQATNGAGENQLDRIRLPRYTGKDGILRTFDEIKARGQWILRLIQNEDDAPEFYTFHCELSDSPIPEQWGSGVTHMFALVTDRRILRIRVSFGASTASQEWAVEFDDLFLAPRIDNSSTVVVTERHGAAKARERALNVKNEFSARALHEAISNSYQAWATEH
ncbi:hypothetical protein HDU93_007411 [Gonapodya sp. JEL0774]|nr:hypothetical protein HDU93_007411 [Gonapodya sp. JEL0774]